MVDLPILRCKITILRTPRALHFASVGVQLHGGAFHADVQAAGVADALTSMGQMAVGLSPKECYILYAIVSWELNHNKKTENRKYMEKWGELRASRKDG